MKKNEIGFERLKSVININSLSHKPDFEYTFLVFTSL